MFSFSHLQHTNKGHISRFSFSISFRGIFSTADHITFPFLWKENGNLKTSHMIAKNYLTQSDFYANLVNSEYISR